MEVKPQLAYHGTAEGNIEKIKKTGLLVPGIDYGPGIGIIGHATDTGFWGKVRERACFESELTHICSKKGHLPEPHRLRVGGLLSRRQRAAHQRSADGPRLQMHDPYSRPAEKSRL